MFRLAIDIGMGFTQSWQKETGQEKLWRALRDLVAQEVYRWGSGASGDVLLLPPATWDSDVEAVAGLIARNVEGPVISIGYSWGGGWRAPRLARALQQHGRGIQHLILCDPVYRSPWLPTWLPINPLSLLRFPTITIPANVRRVSWFFQRVNKPAGHEPVAQDPKLTLIEPGIELGCAHSEMDDAPEYHRRALVWLKEWLVRS